MSVTEPSTTKNLSVFWTAPSKLSVQHLDVPSLGDDDVLIEVISTGICGSDAHVWALRFDRQYWATNPQA
jgi:D-arabinose 1-dehydrogenase-like Zn-dependent alcohol dehydrogenase